MDCSVSNLTAKPHSPSWFLENWVLGAKKLQFVIQTTISRQFKIVLKDFWFNQNFVLKRTLKRKIKITVDKRRAITQGIKNSGFAAQASALLSILFSIRWNGKYELKPLHFMLENRCGAFPTFAHPKSTKMKDVNFLRAN